MRVRAVLAAAVVLASTAAFAADAEVTMQPLRHYGYLIGDALTVEATVRPPAACALDAARLPEPGRVNAFLELRGIDAEPARDTGAWRVRVRYLVVNSGDGVRTATTPSLELPCTRDGAPESSVSLAPVVFTVSALTPETVPNVEGLAEMQPDRDPPRLSTGPVRQRLAAYAGLSLLLALWTAWQRGWVPQRLLRRRPFARAAADLRRMRGSRTARTEADALRRLHRAFDEAAGFAVAGHSLERFFAAHPWAAALEPEVRGFFETSARFFYAGDATAAPAADRLAQLASALAECEPQRTTS